MSHKTAEYRGIAIRYGYDITTDGYRANFVLSEEWRRRPGFQRAVTTNLPAAIAPGKNHADGGTEDEALARARAMIDSYLDGA
ncbi:hypothetical protein [Rhodanobacter aciditrophus]|uniref:hypothetical protein n=1 Tax=Rhodanobacter aciditrophus TaxID=1623218 RepID=UPI003CF30093